jgi:hypothetical protein
MNKKKIVKHLYESARGYGLSEEKLQVCIDAIPEELLEGFIYTFYRIAEKTGPSGFEIEHDEPDTIDESYGSG